jgi:hypothetical protein
MVIHDDWKLMIFPTVIFPLKPSMLPIVPTDFPIKSPHGKAKFFADVSCIISSKSSSAKIQRSVKALSTQLR